MTRPTRILLALFGTAVAVSVVHYYDNWANYAAYPLSQDLPNPSRTTVGVSWFVFTVSGLLGLRLWFRRRYTAAAFALTGYSVSGLIGFGHYATPGALDLAWWRHVHIGADILCGLAIFGFAVWAALRMPRGSQSTDG